MEQAIIIKRGAEAIIEKRDGLIVKTRIKKGYRITELDEKLRMERTRKEAKLLSEAKRAGVNAPTIYHSDKYSIEMELINGKTLRECLDNEKNNLKICEKVGLAISKLHAHNIIHGDLTTSNLLLKNGDIYFIDFGLGSESKKIEDKAFDLRILEEAIEAGHSKNHKTFLNTVIRGYSKYKESGRVLKQLEKIRIRGRYLG